MGVLLEPGSPTPVQITPPPGMRETSYVRAVRGWVTVMGRKFEVPDDKPARVDFQGGDPRNATMDMNLVYNDRADQIKVNVAVTGPISDPKPPTLSSDPPMDQSQLALLVATGHLQTKRNAGQVSGTQEAGSIVGSLITGQVQKAVSKSLPLDTVSLETNSQGEISAEVGKYITDRIYVGYTHNFASQLSPGSLENQDMNINEFNLQYQLSRHWQLEATGGEQQGGVDAIWQKDY